MKVIAHKYKYGWPFLVLWMLFLFSGCASLSVYNPATERKEFVLISTESEVNLGNDVHRQIVEQYKPSADKAQQQRIESIGRRVAQVSDRQDYSYQFFLVESEDPNAFTIPGGRIYLFSGLLGKLKRDEEIAAVLAHEIGHCAARHTAKKYQAALGYSLLGSIVLSQLELEKQAQQLVVNSSDTVMQLIFSAYSREDEYQADKLAVKYMFLAGYDPNEVVRALESLEAESKGASAPLILRTHPYIKDRIQRAQEEIQALLKKKN